MWLLLLLPLNAAQRTRPKSKVLCNSRGEERARVSCDNQRGGAQHLRVCPRFKLLGSLAPTPHSSHLCDLAQVCSLQVLHCVTQVGLACLQHQ